MQTKLNATTLSKREKCLQKHEKRKQFIRTAQTMVEQCAVTPEEVQQKAIVSGRRKSRIAASFIALMGTMKAMPSMAASDTQMFTTVNNAIEFLLQLLTGVGICFVAFGVISLAISFQSHDDSQKSKAIMAIVGGAIAICVRFVIQFLTKGNTDAAKFLKSS